MDHVYDIEFFDEIDSTNSEAKRRIESGKYCNVPECRPFILAAHSQTAGRGRQGKSFYSPKGTGVYLTAACPMDCSIASQVTLTSKAAVAVSRAIEGYFGIECSIKWVNDIYVNDRKCCGILCEAINDYEHDRLRYVIVGVGVNVSTAEWPDEIAQTAGSLRKEPLGDEEFTGFAHRLADEILKVIYEPAGDEMEYYRNHSCVIGNEITFSEKSEDGMKMYNARAVGIDENGGLIVQVNDRETRTLDSGEITVRVPKM